MSRASRAVRTLLIAGLFGWTWTALAGRGGPLTTPELLVDLARDYGLNQRNKQTPADVQHVKTLLRAAIKLNPRLADAYAWLYELESLGDDPQAAQDALEKLVRAAPAHQGAFARWLETGLAGLQTVEKRVNWLQTLLGAGSRPPEQESMIRLALAQLALQRMDRVQARVQLDQALGLDAENPDAALFAFELLEPDAAPSSRLRAALRVLRANPLQAEAAWQVGLLLDEYGFAGEAGVFYQHALNVYRTGNPDAPIPPPYLLQLAQNLTANKRPDQALPYARQAAADPAFVEAKFFLYWLLSRLGPKTEADAVRQQLAQRFGQIRETDEWPVQDIAQAAWFYCRIDPQPQRALSLAEAAAKRAPGDVFATRVLGWAQAMNLRPDEARRTLIPIATQDPYAAYQLAKLLREAGNAQTASRLVQSLINIPRAGPIFELLSELGDLGPATQPAAKQYPDLADVLTEFDRGALEFAKNSAQFLVAAINLPDPNLTPGEPWRVEFALTNQGRFPITLGPNWMINPVFLLSFQVEGERRRDYPNLMTITLDQARVIPPGKTLRLVRTIDIGPLRRVARSTPQQLERISLTAIFDPECDANGQWRPSLCGQRLRTTYFNRLPARVGREALNALFNAVGGESDAARFQALEIMAELLGEKQQADLKRLSYKPEPIPTDRIYQTLLNALDSESWEVRARTLDSLQMVGLDAALIEAARSCLEHPHWLVRLLALRLLARQGLPFAPTVQYLAANDTDELVRDLAASYLAKWNVPPAASQPVSTPPERSRLPAEDFLDKIEPKEPPDVDPEKP